MLEQDFPVVSGFTASFCSILHHFGAYKVVFYNNEIFITVGFGPQLPLIGG
jgi:hypothetical protein